MSDEAAEVMARCMKCKENKPMKDAEEVTMKNGCKAMKGTCADCGCKMFKIVGKKSE